ncbi:hypothetical protein CVD28_13340 [Bacillus sp. M6-12]|uniref:hypothetical protein n=1 Tax=Bacillus sp. M6-12 TaxID=2054166 RepID=UPI000C77A7DD|nr:hypothetical protein [Bacillus sp. M6-12]PLS17238.1 hypothetical protein CVD28_13340 [Bacillus sp. M6-12]
MGMYIRQTLLQYLIYYLKQKRAFCYVLMSDIIINKFSAFTDYKSGVQDGHPKDELPSKEVNHSAPAMVKVMYV